MFDNMLKFEFSPRFMGQYKIQASSHITYDKHACHCKETFSYISCYRCKSLTSFANSGRPIMSWRWSLTKALFTRNVCICIFLWSLPSRADVEYEHHHLLILNPFLNANPNSDVKCEQSLGCCFAGNRRYCGKERRYREMPGGCVHLYIARYRRRWISKRVSWIQIFYCTKTSVNSSHVN